MMDTDIDMEVEGAAELTSSNSTGPNVLWSNPNTRTSGKLSRRERRNMQKMRKNGGTFQSSYHQAYNNDSGASNTTTSSITIPDITLTSATPGMPPTQAPSTASNTDTGHLKPPTSNPRPRRSTRLRAKPTLPLEPMHRLTPTEPKRRPTRTKPNRPINRADAKDHSYRFDLLHKQLGHHERYAKKLDDNVSGFEGHDPRLGPASRAEKLVGAHASVRSDRAGIQKLMRGRHQRPMTEKEEGQSKRLVELHHECYRWDMWVREAYEEFESTSQIDLGAARFVLKGKGVEYRRATGPVWDEIKELKRELGFDFEEDHVPPDPANGIFGVEMLDESRWSKGEQLACAKHFVAIWERELRFWEKRALRSEGLDGDLKIVEHSICNAQSSLRYFRVKVKKFSDPEGEESKERIGEEDKMEVQLKKPKEMEEGMNELVEGVKRL